MSANDTTATTELISIESHALGMQIQLWRTLESSKVLVRPSKCTDKHDKLNAGLRKSYPIVLVAKPLQDNFGFKITYVAPCALQRLGQSVATRRPFLPSSIARSPFGCSTPLHSGHFLSRSSISVGLFERRSKSRHIWPWAGHELCPRGWVNHVSLLMISFSSC